MKKTGMIMVILFRQKVAAKVKQYQSEKFSLHGVLDSGKTKRIPVTDQSGFRNYNRL
jgi:hypothetical protein